MEEIWLDVPNYEDYQASSLGRVRSFAYGYAHILKPVKKPSGYLNVTTCIEQVRKTWRVHRLILYTFIGPSELECNHKNGIKTDNRIENLEYCTASENQKHAFRTGLQRSQHGEAAYFSKLTEKQVLDIYKSKTIARILAKEYSINMATIYRIKNKQTWKHLFV